MARIYEYFTHEQLQDMLETPEDRLEELRKQLENVEEENKYLKQLLADAIPHILCETAKQDALITAIGEKLSG